MVGRSLAIVHTVAVNHTVVVGHHIMVVADHSQVDLQIVMVVHRIEVAVVHITMVDNLLAVDHIEVAHQTVMEEHHTAVVVEHHIMVLAGRISYAVMGLAVHILDFELDYTGQHGLQWIVAIQISMQLVTITTFTMLFEQPRLATAASAVKALQSPNLFHFQRLAVAISEQQGWPSLALVADDGLASVAAIAVVAVASRQLVLLPRRLLFEARSVVAHIFLAFEHICHHPLVQTQSIF